MAVKEFNVNVTMEERWIPCFQSFLHYMHSMGNRGHRGLVGFYADGDGDFRPTFTFDIPRESFELADLKDPTVNDIPEIIFDAG